MTTRGERPGPLPRAIRRLLGLGCFVGGLWSCGGDVIVDGSATSSGGTTSSTSTGTGGGCPAGTCRVIPAGACEPPTGPTGNACCACGPDGTCSQGCKCASPDTPIATPDGDRAIASLRPGDLVYSLHGAAVVAVPLLATRSTPAGPGHRVVRVHLATGATLEVSPLHPTLDGRTFGDLAPGGELGGVEITGVETIPYLHDRTYDILPGSDSGGYFAGGALIGSTLGP